MGTRFKGDNNDPAVNVTNWVLLVTAILSVFARLGTKFRIFHKFTSDDVAIIASLVLCVVQSICVSMAVGSGYGKHLKEVTLPEFDTVMKYLYASSILYLASICASKISLVLFMRNLTQTANDRFFGLFLAIAIGVWAVVSIFGTAFQCSVPGTWNFWSNNCFDLAAWRYFVCASNIVTEILILAQGILLTHRVQTSLTKRLLITSLFLPRVLVIGTVLAELILTRRITETTDPTYEMCVVTILQMLTQCLSVVTACWGQLKPFLTWLKSNGLRIQDVDYMTNAYNSNYAQSEGRSQTQSKARDSRYQSQKGPALSRSKSNQILVTKNWEVDSQSSQADIIQESGAWADAEGTRNVSPENLNH
ncbi:hypothetical protein N7468_000479 [Penicillium chermesinum]|uniref:Rhodopsin domain-containing protein n=1 Tax=Penicillium chermesinum TaxID=63820 RepID=A0A9W9PKB3_9EURO|nr:uncharacterized protein N7468_000479 [Penicillium chermesinum]KAJ5249028.1 hypothetical protein N7468_000479 [Penicillium chermesinum]KAJ6151136.1 hypothetical protein N7470_007730 [Penicillium chermesinum]